MKDEAKPVVWLDEIEPFLKEEAKCRVEERTACEKIMKQLGIDELINDLQAKREFCLDEWMHKTLEDSKVTDWLKCVECGVEKPPEDFHKTFVRHEGICKRCWNSCDEEGYNE